MEDMGARVTQTEIHAGMAFASSGDTYSAIYLYYLDSIKYNVGGNEPS